MIAKDNGGEWHYVESQEAYFYINKDGKVDGKIYAKYVPDPVSLWKEKAKMYEVDINSNQGKKLKPNPVVFKLHEHKRKIAEEKRREVNNANPNK